MEMTKKDRVFLINQYQILAALNVAEADHYKELISILQHGYEIFYSMIDEWVSEDMPRSEGKLVLDILSIYRVIEDLKRGGKNKTLSEHNYSYFRGFDGNNETEYMIFARFLIEEQGKFSEQQAYLSKNDGLNSHTEMLNKYRRMIARWESFGEKWQLSESQALEILDA